VPLASDNDERRCREVRFARCPFHISSARVKDGRFVEIPNSRFGTSFAVVDGVPQPIADYAGYAPFGFAYRRCAGEWLTFSFVNNFGWSSSGYQRSFGVRAQNLTAEPLVHQIYVQVPAYRDRELAKTLLDLYRKAAEPKQLRARVVWQHSADEVLPQAVRDLPALEIVDVPFARSRGCNWARSLLQRDWRGEPYTLLIDSHQRFVRDWDVQLIRMHRELCGGIEKPLITGYLPAYDPEREPGGRRKRPYKIYPLAREQGVLTKLTSYPIPFWTSLHRPIAADFVSLHFIFAAGEFNRELPFDPKIYFFGDEVVTSARAFTAGYDLFHPHVIVGWHCYDRKTRIPHWNDHPGWRDQHERSVVHMRRLLQGRDRSGYGLGNARSLDDYEKSIQVKLVE
jgi:hypothetical protein